MRLLQRQGKGACGRAIGNRQQHQGDLVKEESHLVRRRQREDDAAASICSSIFPTYSLQWRAYFHSRMLCSNPFFPDAGTQRGTYSLQSHVSPWSTILKRGRQIDDIMRNSPAPALLQDFTAVYAVALIRCFANHWAKMSALP